ncbi:MAG: nitrilase [Deltaproteobacteria bacterium]|nr:nitrilase [Deltaproteobacteria bacterium]
MRDIRTAIAVFNAKVGQTRENLNRTVRLTRQAAAEGAELICFPEMNITGYSNHPDILDLAEPIPGPSIKDLIVLSRKEKIVILAGLAEKGVDGNIYASHAVITPDGLNGVYRKLHIAPTEQAMYTAGKQIPIFEYKGIKFGIQLCYDAHFPELSTRMAALGVAVIFIPHASPRGKAPEKHRSWMRHLPARAYDNSLFIVACNQTGSNAKGLCFPGNALVIGPSGHILQKWATGEEALHVFDLEAGELRQVRDNRMHFFLPNRRPELYTP